MIELEDVPFRNGQAARRVLKASRPRMLKDMALLRKRPISGAEEAAKIAAANIRYYMDVRAVSADEILADTGIPKGRLQSFLNGKNDMKISDLYGIAGALGIDPGVLLDGRLVAKGQGRWKRL